MTQRVILGAAKFKRIRPQRKLRFLKARGCIDRFDGNNGFYTEVFS